MVWRTENNFILVSANIVALANFITPRSSWTLAIFLYLCHTSRLPDIKIKMQLVSALSLLAAFFTYPQACEFFSACALGLAMNAGYQIDSVHAPWVINCSLALGVILGHLTGSHLPKFTTSRDIFLLVFTLPNLFMAQSSRSSQVNMSLPFIGPFLDTSWSYALGFIGGMFLPLSSLAKHSRFFIISLILLLQLFTDNVIYQQILSFTRGLFIYNESKHSAEIYFRFGFLLVDWFFNDHLFNYLFIGYLIIAVVLWQDQPRQGRRFRRLPPEKEPLIEEEMKPVTTKSIADP